MKTQTYHICVHSFVDLITNSSTEIFISATTHTVKAVKNLIDHLLGVGGSTLKADDLFEFSRVVEDREAYPSKWHDMESDEGKKIASEAEDDYESPITIELRVKAKDSSNEAAVITAKLLQSLSSIFDVQAIENR